MSEKVGGWRRCGVRWGNRGALAGTSDLIDDTQLHGLPSFRLRRQQSWSGIGQAGDAELQRLREQLQEERESGALSSAVQARLPQQPWNPCFGLCAMHMWHRARKRGAGKLRGRQLRGGVSPKRDCTVLAGTLTCIEQKCSSFRSGNSGCR